MGGRSLGEIRFRLRQEAANLVLLGSRAPAGLDQPAPLERLPRPEEVSGRLRGTKFAEAVLSLAEEIAAHRFPIFGQRIDAGGEVRWRRDYLHGKETGLEYFRRIPYLDFERAGDHKVIWELNRHQHLVVLAQAHVLSGRQDLADEISRQLRSWWEQNPFQRGINWASALEVGLRALSWLWVYHLAGTSMETGFRRRLAGSIYQHGLHVEYNLSTYFSRNTHLVGEAVALLALGALFRAFPRADRWARLGGRIVREEMRFQVRDDGGHFEQSSYYHLYALDMFNFAAVLERQPEWYMTRLGRMTDYLAAIAGPAGTIPFIGDDDGGRVFFPYGPREAFSKATLATSAQLLRRNDLPFDEEDLCEQAVWWLGARATGAALNKAAGASRLLAESGLAVLAAGERHVIVDAGVPGTRSGGHSHAAGLNLVARDGNTEILIDPGTYTYVSDAGRREWFRGTEAHNTVCIDGAGQGVPGGPFRWRTMPATEVMLWRSDEREDKLLACCRYRDISHYRWLWFLKPDLLLIADVIEGPGGQHTVEQRWRPASAGAESRLILDTAAEVRREEAWRSCVYLSFEQAEAIVAVRRGPLPILLGAALDFSGAHAGARILTGTERGAPRWRLGEATYSAASWR